MKNIEIKLNLPKNELLKVISEGKIYLHPPLIELFGLSIVEAIASELIPVVHKDGAAWYDIVSKLDPNLGYTNSIDAKIAISYALQNFDKIQQSAIEQAKNYSLSNFEKQFLSIIKNYTVNL